MTQAEQTTFRTANEVFEKYLPEYSEEIKRSQETEEQRSDRLSKEATEPLLRSLREELNKINLKK